ncbi:MAG: hypothetical protein GF346_10305 [Candidatus Eisenbacteria bacterium]|nr:hypothetical protein [Candidatus Latescibacterota bacterium]MBD3302827.1 hypothetical protein [Candidatus Eisenbacteria bacterium]
MRIPTPVLFPGVLAAEILARLTGQAPLLGFGKFRELRQSYWVCSPEKATGEFGFHPRIDLTKGLEETIRWYLKRGWLRGGR